MATTISGLMMSLGTVNMWGFSPSFNLLENIEKCNNVSSDNSTVINILLVGASDIRHVLHTLAHIAVDNKKPNKSVPCRVNIYMYEPSIEVLARHLLLLHLAQDWEIPIRQRVHMFLEIYGNALVQERTSAYIEEKTEILRNLVYNDKNICGHNIDLTHLKMKSQDELITTFLSWKTNVQFNVQNLRDHRLRHYYETRYDYRDNLIDWDYTMMLKKIPQVSVIHAQQYRQWRNTGIAFEYGDQCYTLPNRTMAAYTEVKKRYHGSVLCRGLWTDIVVSPYISFGVHCESSNKNVQQLFEIHNKGTGVEQNRHNTVEVATYNILSYFYAIENGLPYGMPKTHDIYSGIGATQDKSENADGISRFEHILDADSDNDVDAAENQPNYANESISNDNIAKSNNLLKHVTIIPITGKVTDIFRKKRYTHHFHQVYLSSQYCHLLDSANKSLNNETTSTSIKNCLQDKANLSVETSVFLVPLTGQQRTHFMNEIIRMARSQSMELIDNSIKLPISDEDLLDMRNAVLNLKFSSQY